MNNVHWKQELSPRRCLVKAPAFNIDWLPFNGHSSEFYCNFVTFLIHVSLSRPIAPRPFFYEVVPPERTSKPLVPPFSQYGWVSFDRHCLFQMDPIVFCWNVAVNKEELLTHKPWHFVHFVLQNCRWGTQAEPQSLLSPNPNNRETAWQMARTLSGSLISTSSAWTASLKLNAPHICLACDRIGCEANACRSEVIYHKSLPLQRVKSFIHGLMRLVIQRVRPDWWLILRVVSLSPSNLALPARLPQSILACP